MSQDAQSSQSVAPPPVSAYSWYVLAVLLLLNIVNYIDRGLPYILMESIKTDLNLNDAQIGMLGGALFAVVNSTAGIVLARIADRWSRKYVIVGSLTVWTLLTSVAGFSQNVWHLAATRIGVAAGEAGAIPPSVSLISSYFPQHRRAVAIAVFATGASFGNMFGLFLGGLINDLLSWREAFIIVGAPGAILGVLIAFTLKEPAKPPKSAAAPSTSWATIRFFLSLPSFRHLMAATILIGGFGYAKIAFHPSFLIRTYGISTAEAGLYLGLLYGVIGVGGTLLGGYLSDRFSKTDIRWTVWLSAVVMVVGFPIAVACYFAPTAQLSLILMAAPTLTGLAYLAPSYAAAQILAPEGSRATATALIVFGMSLLGASYSPLLTGAISDYLKPAYGHLSLRYALSIMATVHLWAAFHFYMAGRGMARDAAKAQAMRDAQAAPG